MKRLLAKWLLVAAGTAISVSIVCVEAAVATGTVQGSVARLGAPVVAARVVIASASDSSYGASASSDTDGAFTFSAVPLGKVQLKVYDAQDNLLVSGTGVLDFADQIITVTLNVGA